MKIYNTAILILFPVASAFSVASYAKNVVSSTSRSSMYFAQETEEEKSIYDRIGFPEEKVALGIDPNQVAEWIGDREAIYTKIKEDNKDFDEARVNLEVDKFMMDAELVNFYIEYQKRKAAGTLQETRNTPPSLLTLGLGAYVSFVAFNSLKSIFFKNDEAIGVDSSDSVVNTITDTMQNMDSSNTVIQTITAAAQNSDIQSIADTASNINF